VDEQMFILLARADFRLLVQGSAVPKLASTITAVFDPRYFSVDSRNENLPDKCIHQNYVWIAVSVRPGIGMIGWRHRFAGYGAIGASSTRFGA
jgi:hypothetical protein